MLAVRRHPLPSRSLLRGQIRRAWRRTINSGYSERLVNSERGLQVHFCIALLEEFRASKVIRRLFVEPTILFGDSTKRSPDLVICNSRQVIGVVEFKYVPRARPTVEKDMNTLLRLGSADRGIGIANDRFRGVGEVRHYTVASDAVLCWAGVYAGKLLALPPRTVLKLGGRFMRLDALTRDGAAVEIP